jgi:glycosyltransferase involved in cell wall biosynthesis
VPQSPIDHLAKCSPLPDGSSLYDRLVRVGLSLLTLVPGISGGSEIYARELARALGRSGTLEYELILPTIARDVDGLPSVVAEEYRASRDTGGRLRAMAQASVGRKVRRRLAGYDAVHFPLTVMVPPLRSRPVVTSILDVQHAFYPEFFSRSERAYRAIVYGWTARLSDLVITISMHAADTIAERLSVPRERLRVIPFGLDHARFRPGAEARGEFVVFPARGWPHKNHARLFEALALVRQRRPALRLLLPGYEGAVPDGVEALGWTDQDELARLYRSAAAMVFPSLYEGFGQPPLEAMACGCPVASSNAASLPEVCGDGAVLFDPTSVEAMAAAIETALDDDGTLARRGVANAARFSWERAAAEHDAVYRELGGV